MVAVDHEIDLAELDGDDRREITARKRRREGADPVAARFVPGLERACERCDPPFGADDVREWNRLDAERAARDRRQPALDVRKLEQAGLGLRAQQLHIARSIATGGARVSET